MLVPLAGWVGGRPKAPGVAVQRNKGIIMLGLAWEVWHDPWLKVCMVK